eukprot:13869042-Alexandrium_andersonii.AAC.1
MLKLRATALFALDSFVAICDGAGLFLSSAQAARACEHGWLFLRTYQTLARMCLVEKRCLYKMRPEAHYFDHLLLAIATSRENPRRHHLMGAEDFMAK